MPTPLITLGDPDLGRKLYVANCATCHGITARGELNMGPSLINQDFLNATSDEFIWDTTAYGRSGTPMGPSLEGLSGVRQLSEKEINAIIAYLRSEGKK
jgi:mono/diheme cytochrome c family protein